MLHRLWEFLHLVFAFSYVGSLVVAEWNGRAARATSDWGQRSALFQIVHLSGRIAGTGSLFLSGLLGHLVANGYGYSMARDRWLWLVTALWLAALAVQALLLVPQALQLTQVARAGAAGGDTAGWVPALARWRVGNLVQSVLYIAMLALMVFPWRS